MTLEFLESAKGKNKTPRTSSRALRKILSATHVFGAGVQPTLLFVRRGLLLTARGLRVTRFCTWETLQILCKDSAFPLALGGNQLQFKAARPT